MSSSPYPACHRPDLAIYHVDVPSGRRELECSTVSELRARVEHVTTELARRCVHTPSDVPADAWLASVRTAFAVLAPEHPLELAIPDDLRLVFETIRGSLSSAEGLLGWDFVLFGPHLNGGPGEASEDEPWGPRTVRDNLARRGAWEPIGRARDHHTFWCCLDRSRPEFGAICHDADDFDYFCQGMPLAADYASTLSFLEALI
jgi:hypothetical protein